MTTLRERQAPLKARYESDPESAKLVMTVHSTTAGDDPTRCTVASIDGLGGNAVAWDAGAHPMAGGEGDLACSGDILLASLAACQEITLRMVAAAMGVQLQNVEVTIEGDLDFRGTMGIDPETPVGFQQIRTSVRFDAEAPPDRLQRLADRAERYCVVGATLREGTSLTTSIAARGSNGDADNG
ncbi:MAG: OsmC family protein [Chloroflexi bacterium]|nr:OsmC family protein [Chloroflexota bacterium]